MAIGTSGHPTGTGSPDGRLIDGGQPRFPGSTWDDRFGRVTGTLCPGVCPDLCLTYLACLACLERSGRISASASCRHRASHTHLQNHCRCVSRWLHLDTFQFGSGSGHFQTQRHNPKAMADLLPDCFIWTPLVEIWIKPFPSPHTHQKHNRFSPRRLHSDTSLSRSGSSHFRTKMHIPKAIADLLSDGFMWTPFCPDLGQAIFESGF